MNDMNEQDRIRLNRIEEALETLTLKTDKVYYAITGNDLDGNRGIVYRLGVTEEKISRIESEFIRVKWIIIGWGIGAGVFGGSIVSTFINKFMQ
jgi:hypothetical protein